MNRLYHDFESGMKTLQREYIR